MDRTRAVRKVLIYTLVCNIIVALAKVLYGYFTNSIAMLSDGFHSFFDGFSNVLGLLGIWIAAHPPDSKHPYGHKKYETLFTIAIAVMIFFTCYQIVLKLYDSFFKEHITVVTPVSFYIMLITIAVNVSVMVYEIRKGRDLKSDFLIADAKHTKSDIFVSIAVIIGLIFSRLGFQKADIIIGIVIMALIARIGYEIVRSASDVLVDSVIIEIPEVESVVNSIKGVRGSHDIRTRGTETSVFIDLHILVDPAVSVQEAHIIADGVEEILKDKFPSVVDVVVHVEPE